MRGGSVRPRGEVVTLVCVAQGGALGGPAHFAEAIMTTFVVFAATELTGILAEAIMPKDVLIASTKFHRA